MVILDDASVKNDTQSLPDSEPMETDIENKDKKSVIKDEPKNVLSEPPSIKSDTPLSPVDSAPTTRSPSIAGDKISLTSMTEKVSAEPSPSPSQVLTMSLGDIVMPSPLSKDTPTRDGTPKHVTSKEAGQKILSLKAMPPKHAKEPIKTPVSPPSRGGRLNMPMPPMEDEINSDMEKTPYR